MELKNLLSSKKILVVDDNLVNLLVAAGSLKKHGAIPTCVKSGRDAIELLKPPHHFDACFMDMHMPETDGFQASREIRVQESQYNERIESEEVENDTNSKFVHWRTPILAMVADVIDTQYSVEQYLSCGIDGYLEKPFSNEQIYGALVTIFGPNT